MLLGELLTGKLVQDSHLLGENLSLCESLRHEHVLTNEKKIRGGHDDWSEESLQVIWQLRSSGVTWVHGDEDSYSWDKFHIHLSEKDLLLPLLESILNDLDLDGDHREYLNINSVELIEATPESSLDKT